MGYKPRREDQKQAIQYDRGACVTSKGINTTARSAQRMTSGHEIHSRSCNCNEREARMQLPAGEEVLSRCTGFRCRNEQSFFRQSDRGNTTDGGFSSHGVPTVIILFRLGFPSIKHPFVGTTTYGNPWKPPDQYRSSL